MMVQWFDCSAVACHAPHGSHRNSLVRQQARTEGESREQDQRRTPNNKILGSCLNIEEPSDQDRRIPNNTAPKS
jgi:predicted CXXCH cytochrome family protein